MIGMAIIQNPVLNKVLIAPFVGATNNNAPQPPYDPFVGPYSATDSLEPVGKHKLAGCFIQTCHCNIQLTLLFPAAPVKAGS